MRKTGKSIVNLVIVFSCLSALLLYPQPHVHAQELILVSGDWPPYIDSEAPDKGFVSRIVVEAYQRAGIDARIKIEPWKRVADDVDKKKNISFGWYYNSERAQKWLFSDEITQSRVVFAVRSDTDFTWNTLEDLKPYKIGITRGYSNGDEFDQFKGQLQIEEASSDEINFKKLLKGRFDLFPIDPLVGTLLLQTRFTPKQRKQIQFITEKPLASMGVHVVCAKTNDRCLHFIGKFNYGFAALQQEGVLKSIVEKAASFK